MRKTKMTLAQARKLLAVFKDRTVQQHSVELGIPRSTLSARVQIAKAVVAEKNPSDPLLSFRNRKSGNHNQPGPVQARSVVSPEQRADALLDGDDEAVQALTLEEQVKRYKTKLRQLTNQMLNENKVRSEIFGLSQFQARIPAWVQDPESGKSGSDSPGVPILFASDWHWGEVVKASEIGGVNSYNMEIARKRARNMIERAIYLLKHELTRKEYPGIVFALGGDMVSGNIHEELAETNDQPIMPVVHDIVIHLAACIHRLKEVFGRVFVPCVTGNHGRLHKKVRAKESNYNSFDWLIYMWLEAHFSRDPDVVFHIPDGPDALVSIYGRRYLFTHGNQFRGGDGLIGPIGPLTRGDHKKRSRNAQIGHEYDTLVVGHFHQLIQTERIIVNGSLKGYDEYAYSNNFGYEPARQALWITHPREGITFQMPVNVEHSLKVAREQERDVPASSWVSFKQAAGHQATLHKSTTLH